MSLFFGRKLTIKLAAFLLLGGSFLFIFSLQGARAASSTSTYEKEYNGTLTSSEWNDLFTDFVNTWLPVSMNGPLGIATSAPASGLEVNGTIQAVDLFASGDFGVGTTAPNDIFSITDSGTAAPLGSVGTGHNYTASYLSTDDYALANYGLVKTLIAGGSGETVGYWSLSGSNLYADSNDWKVGIGLLLPQSKLHVQDDTYATRGEFEVGQPSNGYMGISLNGLTKTLGNMNILSGINDQQLILNRPTGKNFSVRENNSVQLMVLPTSGNVGIGTSTPAEKLSVVGNVLVDLDASGAASFVENPLGATSTGKIQLGRTTDGWESISFDPTLGTNGNFVFSAPLLVAASSPGITFYDPDNPTDTDLQRSIEYDAGTLQLKIGDSLKTNFSTNTGLPPTSKTFFQIGPNDLTGQDSSGTFIGANPPANFVGDLLNFQVGGITRFRVTKFGDIISGGATMTTNAPILNTSQTWNEANTEFTAWLMNITDTNSTSTSKLLDLQVASTSKFAILKSGYVGIGTTAPAAPLEVAPVSGYAILAGTSTEMSYKIGNVAAPTADTDVVTKGYVDSTFILSGSSTTAVLVGVTTGIYNGDNSGTAGYAYAHAECAGEYAGSHVCATFEILNTIKDGGSPPSEDAWVFNGPPAYTALANDCNARTNNTSAAYGTYWQKPATGFPEGRGLLMQCNNSIRFACCQ
ncbi:TPA: hypothetical protein DCZ15_02295 [Candidatus Falkowbacteria bacterium]|nr:MAG: hypothetical protein UV95_C0001G0148 [Candidatus Falkowbacteria bacterium GW2011_GWF2_43_32]HBA36684.1 hypothetical protein [Candidatus Falkowbacteria bacterium]